MTVHHDPEIERMLDAAAERGAKRALERLGLHDDDASKDITDLRTLIDGWRNAKSTVAKAVVNWITMGILGLLILGVYTQTKGK
jgi:hypothetical protein